MNRLAQPLRMPMFVPDNTALRRQWPRARAVLCSHMITGRCCVVDPAGVIAEVTTVAAMAEPEALSGWEVVIYDADLARVAAFYAEPLTPPPPAP